jgi:arylsulfatase A-like enzyme
MQLPSLRQPAVAASVLAGVFGAGLVDAALTVASGGPAAPVLLLALGLYGAVGLLASGGAALVMAGLRGAWPPGWGWLPAEPERDRAVASGILAACVAIRVIAIVVAAGQRVLVSNMSSQKLATIAAGGLVAVGALPAAIAAIAALPLLRYVARLIPRPRGLGATGVLLLALAAAAGLAFIAALSRADWRVLNLGPLYTLVVATVLGAAHGLFWFALPAGRALRARLPAAVGAGLTAVVAGAAVIGLVASARMPEGAPVFGAVSDGSWGLRFLLNVARRATDVDRDGFSARFGGGDCDDRRADVFPGAEDIPGDGIDGNCEGGDAKLAADTGGGAGAQAGGGEDAAPPAKITPRADAFKGNLLIITIDALRADRLGVAGYGRPQGKSLTPTLDALARKGAYFRRAWSHAPNTPRSFPSILTGRYPSDIAWDKPGVNYPNLLPSNRTFFQTLAAAGLTPIGIFSHFYFTTDRGISRGFAEWTNDGAGTIAESNKDIASPRIVPRVIERLKKAAANKERFVMWTHLFEPHSSYMVHKEFPTSLTGVTGLMEKYDFEIAFTDRWVGKLVDAVKELGLAESTAIVIMADHGEAWGEHKHYFHGQDLFEEQLRVPLIIMVPGQAARRIDDPVSLVDVGPTLLELVGAPVPANMRGRSLMPYVEGTGTPPGARPVFAELMPATAWPHQAAMMVDGNHKLIHRISDRRWELYDLKADAEEKKNLADAPAAATVFGDLKAKLLAFEERAR